MRPSKGRTSYSPLLRLTAVCLPRSWDLPCALSQSLQNVSQAPIPPLLPAKLGGRGGAGQGWGLQRPYHCTLLVWVGDDRPHGVIRTLNGGFLDTPTPALLLQDRALSGVQAGEPVGTACHLARHHKVALKEGREGLWVLEKKVRGGKIVAAPMGPPGSHLVGVFPHAQLPAVEYPMLGILG